MKFVTRAKLHWLTCVSAAALLLPSCDFVDDLTKDWTNGEASFVPTPIEVVDRMLELSEVTKDDVVYDLGSGDGRVVIRAAKRFGARGVGVEINRELVDLSRTRAREEGVSHLVDFRLQDALTVDLSEASVVALYLTPEFNSKLRPILERQLQPRARVVSHDHAMEGWTPDKLETMPGGLFHRHRIYLWRMEERKPSPRR